MKRIMIVLAGLVMSLYMMAYQTVNHNETRQSDPYTCMQTEPLTLKTTYSGSYGQYVQYYEMDANGYGWTELKNQSNYGNGGYNIKDAEVGTHVYAVLVWHREINAPQRRMPAAQSGIPALPEPTGNGVSIDHYDVYYLTVNYHTEEHVYHLEADQNSGTLDLTLYTTAGTTDRETGKEFCGGNTKYSIAKGTTVNDIYTQGFIYNEDNFLETVTLAPGHYIYSVFIHQRNGYDEELAITWCDRFDIYVDEPYVPHTEDIYITRTANNTLTADISTMESTPTGYQWYVNGEPIDGATEQDLYLPDVPGLEEGDVFTVDVYTDENEYESHPYTLTDVPDVPGDLSDCQSGLVFTKWDDFMFVNNGWAIVDNVEGGKGEFEKYQWYHNDQPIQGATNQWYRTTQTEKEMPNGEYFVKITKKDGSVIITCPKSFRELPRSEEYNHQGYSAPSRKSLEDGHLVIEIDGHVYNAQGAIIR